MAQEAVNTKAVDFVGLGSARDEFKDRAQRGELVLGIRIDALPESEAKRLADAGFFHPLTLDKDGSLRVALRSDTQVAVKSLAVFEDMRLLLIELRNLLMEIA